MIDPKVGLSPQSSTNEHTPEQAKDCHESGDVIHIRCSAQTALPMLPLMKADFTTVPCPKCGATAGSPCQSAGGNKIPAGYSHVARVHLFAEQERVSLARKTDT
jgi:hypothetical protein